MNIKDLIEGYYAGTLTDTEEEQLEMLMKSAHPDIPKEERRLYLGLANLPITDRPAKRHNAFALRATSIAATVALVLGLGYYLYIEQQRQIVTEQEILELAMGNMGKALHKSDTTRQQLATIINKIGTDTSTQETNKASGI